MTIKKFTGKTKEEAIEAARAELGSQVVIMNVKESKEGGFMGMFKKTIIEVTAAIEDTDDTPGFRPVTPVAKSNEGSYFNASADESIPISQISGVKKSTSPNAVNNAYSSEKPTQLQDAFAAVSEVIKNTSDMDNKNNNKPVPIKTLDEAPKVKPVETVPNLAPTVAPVETKTEPLAKKIPESFNSNEPRFSSGYQGDNQKFVKMLYNMLLENEVQEKYINQLMDDMENVLRRGNNIDFLISNVYQKLVLKLGKPHEIKTTDNIPKVVFFIGPTGVGKTTTIAKIASKLKIEQHKEVALITADTYRIAATDQLRTYAEILGTPLSVIYTPDEINDAVEKFSNMDVILVDTAGFSHKNQQQKADMEKMLNVLDEAYDKDIYLVLSATTKYKDLTDILDTYSQFTGYNLIFTKLDETSNYGNILNCKLYSKANLSYLTVGQNVPNDIEVVDTQKMVKQLLGGR